MLHKEDALKKLRSINGLDSIKRTLVSVFNETPEDLHSCMSNVYSIAFDLHFQELGIMLSLVQQVASHTELVLAMSQWFTPANISANALKTISMTTKGTLGAFESIVQYRNLPANELEALRPIFQVLASTAEYYAMQEGVADRVFHASFALGSYLLADNVVAVKNLLHQNQASLLENQLKWVTNLQLLELEIADDPVFVALLSTVMSPETQGEFLGLFKQSAQVTA